MRSLIVWAPILVGALSVLVWNWSGGESRSLGWWIVEIAHSPGAPFALGLFLAGVLWTLLSPGRALQDRLAGKFLVPR